MSPWTLDANWAQEPWRLWTCHLAHFDVRHAVVNLAALAVPLLLVARMDRFRLGSMLLLLAPLLSLSILPFLDGGTYSGASGIACAAWACVGIRLAGRRESFSLGCLVLGLLGLKFAVEGLTGAGVLVHGGGWQTLAEAHTVGALLGLAAGVFDNGIRTVERRSRLRTGGLFRKWLTFPR